MSNSTGDVVATWQHIDGTPQETSQGLFQCGPYCVNLLRMRIVDRDICYDGKSIDCSINAITKYILLNKQGHVVKEFEKNNCANLVVTNGAYGKSVDITKEYKSSEKKPFKKEKDPSKKILMDLKVPDSINIHDELDYSICIKNSSKNTSTILVLVLELRNEYGANILETPVTNSIVFMDSDFSFTGKFDKIELKNNVDLSMAIIFWELRCYDHVLDKLKVFSHQTRLMPFLTGQIEISAFLIGKTSTDVHLNIKNLLKTDIQSCKIIITIKNNYQQRYEQIIQNLGADSEKSLTFCLNNLSLGYQTIEAWIECEYFNKKLDKKNILVIY
ncbi:hypothetical protein MXB_1200 [Myxobolus squamalis]|nr:hypothetical protein MXB_1200 [Myxobolus squamalis]